MKTMNLKRSEADERQAEYDTLTNEEKLERAIQRGHSGTREAKRLAALCEPDVAAAAMLSRDALVAAAEASV